MLITCALCSLPRKEEVHTDFFIPYKGVITAFNSEGISRMVITRKWTAETGESASNLGNIMTTSTSPSGRFMYKLNKLLFWALHCDGLQEVN
jgi:hypothetical protein